MAPRRPTIPMLWPRRQGVEPAAPASSPALLSVKDAAERIQVSTQTIRRMIKAGLKIYRAGRQISIAEQDLMDFISL